MAVLLEKDSVQEAKMAVLLKKTNAQAAQIASGRLSAPSGQHRCLVESTPGRIMDDKYKTNPIRQI